MMGRAKPRQAACLKPAARLLRVNFLTVETAYFPFWSKDIELRKNQSQNSVLLAQNANLP
jgi:hypothetical protein